MSKKQVLAVAASLVIGGILCAAVLGLPVGTMIDKDGVLLHLLEIGQSFCREGVVQRYEAVHLDQLADIEQ